MASTALRVKELLKEYGWTTKVLAEKTGMSESYLTHIKNGTRRWNEDALRKIAEAFQKNPVDLFMNRQFVRPEETDEKISAEATAINEELKEKATKVVVKVPMVGEIPSYPSEYNNQATQVTTGYKGSFVPSMLTGDPALFGYVVENNLLAPRFTKGDCLLVSPATSVNSGDLAAVEYKTDKEAIRAIMIVTYLDDFVLLETANHKSPPIALVKGKDHLRVIGKVVFRYQKI